jgi:hypothetical protein
VDAEHVRMRESRGELNLLQEPLGARRCHEVGHHHLHGNGPRVAEVARQEHRRHAAASELALEDVAAR